jgi:hypothetical protein
MQEVEKFSSSLSYSSIFIAACLPFIIITQDERKNRKERNKIGKEGKERESMMRKNELKIKFSFIYKKKIKFFFPSTSL